MKSEWLEYCIGVSTLFVLIYSFFYDVIIGKNAEWSYVGSLYIISYQQMEI